MKKLVVGLLSLYVIVYASDAAALHADVSELEQKPQVDAYYSRNWIPFSPPGAVDDRLTHATAYDPANDIIYMIGGTPNGQSGSLVNLIYAYDPNTDTWDTTLMLMPEARGWMQAAYWNGRIYVIAGYTNAGAGSNTNYQYDIGGNSWSQGTNLPRRTLAHGVVSWNGNIYVIGGLDVGMTQGTTNVDRYDIASDSWSIATSLPEQWDMGGICIFSNEIWIIGGYNRGSGQTWTTVIIGTINPSDPDDITWTTGYTIPFPLALNSATASSTHCFSLGGIDTLGNSPFYVWDPINGGGERLDDYPVPIVRGDYCIARHDFNEVFGVAGDANGDWGPPNNYYYKYLYSGIEEENAIIRNHYLGSTILRGPLVLPKDKICKVFDITGRVVAPEKIKPGIYFIEVDGEITQKVIKVR